MKRFARPSWDALRMFAEKHFAGIMHDFWFDWPRFLRWSVLVALPLVATMHVVLAITIQGGSLLGLVVVAGASLVAAVLLVLQGWALWQTHVDATERRPYIVAVLLLAVTVSVCTEAFAGLTLWLASNGWVTSHEAAPSLWTAERFYLWHLIDSVPLLSITRTLGLARPLAFSGVASGALILLFKITLILPLVRLAIAGYQLLATANDAAIERAAERRRRGQKDLFRHDGELWMLALFLFGATAVIAVSVFFVFNPESAMNRWLAAHLAPGISVGRVHVPMAWLQTAPQWVGTGALIYFTVMTADFVSWSSDSTFHSLSDVVSGVLSYLAMLCLLTLIGVTVSLTLLHVGLVQTQAAIPPHAQVWAAISAHTRSVAEAIPGLNVPERLEWTLAYPFIGIVSGLLILLYKIAFLGVLIVPITRIVRSFVRRRRPRAIVAALTASGEFITLLRTTQSMLDEVERNTLADRDGKGRGRAALARWRNAEAASATRPATLYDIDELIVQLEDSFARVTTLFGEGEIRTSADGALGAVLRSRDHLRDLGWLRPGLRLRGESPADALTKERSDLKEKTESFRKLAAEALAQQKLLATPRR